MKGKNYSCNNKAEKRNKNDFYQTPYSITRHLLNNETFNYNLKILEPCCGNNAIVNILKEKWNDNLITYYDIEKDFLTETETDKYSYIILNPPYRLAYDFILKCKEICNKKFAMLLPLNYLHGKKRYDNIYCDINYPLKKVYIFTRYPLLTSDDVREDGHYNTGMMVYAWFIFEKDYIGKTEIDWIDNNNDVLKK
jgi:hypothetical protein